MLKGPGPVFVEFGLDVPIEDFFHRDAVEDSALDGSVELVAEEVEHGVTSFMAGGGFLVGAVGVEFFAASGVGAGFAEQVGLGDAESPGGEGVGEVGFFAHQSSGVDEFGDFGGGSFRADPYESGDRGVSVAAVDAAPVEFVDEGGLVGFELAAGGFGVAEVLDECSVFEVVEVDRVLAQ